MTWILGSGIPFGHAALVSDVRVTWPNGQSLDRLQKIYQIGPGLTAGFAGSVAVGFWMIFLMQRLWSAAPGTLYPVKFMAWHWHRYARWFYATQVNDRFKPAGCELMIAGVSPEVHAFGAFSHAVVMRAPEFTPEIARPWRWCSIGAGARHLGADHLQNPGESFPAWINAEVGQRGGAARMVAHLVAGDLEDAPMASVSPILQVAVVRHDQYEILGLRRERRGHGPSRTRNPSGPAN